MSLNETIKENEKLVMAVATEFHVLDGDKPDLFQEGRIGLWRAIETFDPERGASFKTHACRSIRHAMLDFVRSRGFSYSEDVAFDSRMEGEAVSVPATQEDEVYERECRDLIAAALGDIPEARRSLLKMRLNGAGLEKIANEHGVSVTTVRRGLNAVVPQIREAVANLDPANDVDRAAG